MREQKQDQNRYSWQHLKEDLGAVGGVLAFLAVVLGAAVLPGLLSDSASTVGQRVMQAAHR